MSFKTSTTPAVGGQDPPREATWISSRAWWRIWAAGLVVWIALFLVPVSNGWTRLGVIVILFLLWSALIMLTWQRKPCCYPVIAFGLICAGLIALPARHSPDTARLRQEYVERLGRYEGVPYVWGGENFLGIDCSGLVRRELIDALCLRGLCTLDGRLIRQGLRLWWQDCSAKDLADARKQLTVPVAKAASLNGLDPNLILPGDLAVTSGGVHVLAYLGNQVWIEADPGRRVMKLTVPSSNPWTQMRVEIVRWRTLQAEGK